MTHFQNIKNKTPFLIQTQKPMKNLLQKMKMIQKKKQIQIKIQINSIA